jgi:hypothetical protein
MKKLSILFAVIFSVASFSGLASAATVRTVCSSGCDSTTIQGAINSSSNGDVVLVRPGTYTEDIDFGGKAIEVTSQGCPEETIIDADGESNSVVTFDTSETSSSILNGFTIKNGDGTLISGNRYGGGIYIYYASPTIKNCIITSNDASLYGGGIYTDHGSPVIDNCVVSYNTAKDGAGISSRRSTDVVIKNNTNINNNTASRNGGGVNVYLGDISITDSTVADNTANGVGSGSPNGGGGIHSVGVAGSTTIDNCTISGNTGVYYGGGLTGQGFTIKNGTTITDNTANQGGGIYATYNVDISDSFVDGNHAGYGGGLYSSANGVTVEDTTFDSNDANGGAGIYSKAADSFTRCYITNNSATPGVPYYSNGGGIYMVFGTSSVRTFTNCVVTGNEIDGNYATDSGAGVYIGTAAADFINCTVANNKINKTSSPVADGTEFIIGGASSVVNIKNSIVWNEISGQDVFNVIYIVGTQTVDISYSDFDPDRVGPGTYTGSNNINADPDFVGSGSYPYDIESTSDCIDAGTSTGAPTDDIHEDTRDSSPDMGADEYIAP